MYYFTVILYVTNELLAGLSLASPNGVPWGNLPTDVRLLAEGAQPSSKLCLHCTNPWQTDPNPRGTQQSSPKQVISFDIMGTLPWILALNVIRVLLESKRSKFYLDIPPIVQLHISAICRKVDPWLNYMYDLNSLKEECVDFTDSIVSPNWFCFFKLIRHGWSCYHVK